MVALALVCPATSAEGNARLVRVTGMSFSTSVCSSCPASLFSESTMMGMAPGSSYSVSLKSHSTLY